MNLRRKLASQSAIIFAVRLIGAGLIFLAQAAIARAWGTPVLGEYLLVIATVNLVAMVIPLGFHTIGTYFTAEYRARGEGRRLRRFITRAYGQGLMASVLIFSAGWLALPLLGTAGKVVSAFWLQIAVLTIATATVFINSAVLVGMKRPYAGFFADGFFRPMLVIASFAVTALVLAPKGAELATMFTLFAGGYALVALVHLGMTLRSVFSVPHGEADDAEARRWWRFAVPWVLVSLATDFFFDIDLLALSTVMSRADLAIFGVCARIFALVSFGVAAVYAVTLPDVFEAEANSDREGFNRKIGDANLVATALSVVFFAAMGVGGPFALLLFGPAFLVGSGPLAVLCLALVIRSAFGPAPLVLSIHDRPYASLPAIGCGVGTLIGGNYLLVPALGLMGASISALIAITVWSGLLWLTARRVAGIDVSVFARLASGRPVGTIMPQKPAEAARKG